MEQGERKLLTRDKIKRDLEYVLQRRPPTWYSVGVSVLIPIGLFLAIFTFSYSQILALTCACLSVFSLLLLFVITDKKKNWIDSEDMETLVFGTDLCTGTGVIPATIDEPSYEYFVLVNGGRIFENGGGIGFPDTAKPREEFIVVSLERDPKVRMYYSKDKWFLEKDREGEEAPC